MEGGPLEALTMCSITAKFGCTAETLRRWVRQAERGSIAKPGMTSDDRERVGALEREVRELHQANQILRKAGTSRRAFPDSALIGNISGLENAL